MKQTQSFQKLVSIAEDDDEDQGTGSSVLSCNKPWCWWNPPQKSLPVAFCKETSIHGCKFLGQEKRHLSERVFWLVGFFLSLGTAIYLIYGVWNRFQLVPVIVSFQSSEQGMDTMPFPAVTICNMNKFPRSKVLELERIVQSSSSTPAEKRLAKRQLVYVRNICDSQQSLAKELKFAYQRGSNKKKFEEPDNGEQSENDTVITGEGQVDYTDFLMNYTLPCGELIRLCTLGEKRRDCSELFRPIVVDYGKCCTFNILPLPLLTKNPQNENQTDASIYDNPVLGSSGRETWPEEELGIWSLWNYDEGFKLDGKLPKPWRQKRAGLPYGLSMLLDSNTEDYYCPASDSVGLRYILHTPLEMPSVMSFSSLAHMQKEILVEVHPEVTNADPDIRQIDHVKRMCYFGKEKSLRYFGPYTSGNCVDECMGRLLAEECKCALFYMPRNGGIRTCDSDPNSKDNKCMVKTRMELQTQLKEVCSDCRALCEDISYHYETTIAEIQNPKELWEEPDLEYHPEGPPHWANHNMSIIHIFFGAESTVPKFRKRLYGPMDLIANTGGILGLCLGFSILSGVEVIYFITLRAFWKHCRKRMLKRRQQRQQEKQATQFHRHSVNPAKLPLDLITPAYPTKDGKITLQPPQVSNVKWGKWGNSQGHHFYGYNSFQK